MASLSWSAIASSREIAPNNVAVTACDAKGFALVDNSTLSQTATREWANQVAIGLLAHGYSVCRPDASHPAANRITLDAGVTTVDYGDVRVQRLYDEAPHEDETSAGLALAVATEELVLIATDPNAPKPPPPVKPLPPRERFRLGGEVSALAYAHTHVGVAAALRYDLFLSERWRLGAALGFDHVSSERSAAGYVRYNSLDAQLGLHAVLLRSDVFALVVGAAGAPLMAFGRGQARDGFSGHSASHVVVVARALVDGEFRVSQHQTIVLRAGFGRPLVSFDARGDNGAEYGGLATWEARFGAGWLWSFF